MPGAMKIRIPLPFEETVSDILKAKPPARPIKGSRKRLKRTAKKKR